MRASHLRNAAARRARPFAALLPLALLAACSGEPPGPKNLILVSIDTLRPDRLGLYGYERETSPFLDGFAAEAVVFEQAIAQAPWTAPSHASLLSSLYPSMLGMGRFDDPGRIADSVEMLAEVLLDEGFRTHAITSGGFMASRIGFDQGFEIYDDDGLNMGQTVAKAHDWLRGIRKDERFFLFLHTYDVHKYKPAEEWRARFAAPYDGPLRHDERVADLVQNHENAARAAALDEADRRYVQDLYDASVAETDAHLARLWEIVRELERDEDTLVVITADHGEEFWEHGGTGHGYTLYDENLRVPLLVRHPSLPPRRVSDQVRLLDVAPTVADLLGVRKASSWQGESLFSLSRPLVAYAEHAHHPLKAVRTPEHKLVVGLAQPTRQFFSLASDPLEQDGRIEAAPPAPLADLVRGAQNWIEACAQVTAYRSQSGVEFDAEERAQIEALGYVSGGAEGGEHELAVEAWRRLLQGKTPADSADSAAK